jgi:hypothetical protein
MKVWKIEIPVVATTAETTINTTAITATNVVMYQIWR